MLSEVLKQKHTRNFLVYDRDKNGYIEKKDLEICAANLASLRGWKSEMPEFKDITAQYVAIWTNFWQPADSNGDGKVELEEYLKVVEKSIANFANSAELQEAHANKANMIFDILDGSGNGTIELSEYVQFCKTVEIDENVAKEAFVRLDQNGDGVISRDEYMERSQEFHTSDDPNAAGNWLYGSYS